MPQLLLQGRLDSCSLFVTSLPRGCMLNFISSTLNFHRYVFGVIALVALHVFSNMMAMVIEDYSPDTYLPNRRRMRPETEAVYANRIQYNYDKRMLMLGACLTQSNPMTSPQC